MKHRENALHRQACKELFHFNLWSARSTNCFQTSVFSSKHPKGTAALSE
ncbi:hypothetical protein BRADI_1g57795v3 [Brachypodium distachyon]|uniref:Uncharacterized protein n=1 Tax=Brachypodium distachyon TaxID=15368 RepID=A0A2K2DS48_BRADI|nr:hypothetical protein BRADI_1g57795v3 [Brachypodium distachyon]